MPGNSRATKLCTIVDSSTRLRSVAALRQRDDARQRARRLHDREVAVAPERILARQPHDEVQALVLDARERARRDRGRAGSAPAPLRARSSPPASAPRPPTSPPPTAGGCPAARAPAAACRSGRRTAPRRVASRGRGSPRAAPGSACRSGPVCVAPRSRRCLRPATRISKNSSRLFELMQRKRSRSSSGSAASRACASTRSLNSRKRQLAIAEIGGRIEVGYLHRSDSLPRRRYSPMTPL